jgi:hypothetical protein
MKLRKILNGENLTPKLELLKFSIEGGVGGGRTLYRGTLTGGFTVQVQLRNKNSDS